MSDFTISQDAGGGSDTATDTPEPDTSTDTPNVDRNPADYDLHENVTIDLIRYSRSCQALNEAQFLLTTLGYLSGLFENPSHYISGVIIGTSSSGKTHMQQRLEKLFPDGWLYNFTTGSDQTIAYDDEWDDSLIASLDEMNKVSEELTEVLKSVHGGDEKFKRKVVQDWRTEEMKELEREAMPYWFLYAQFDSDFELWNRLLKVPVHEGKAKNEAVLRLQFDHHNIEFEDNEFTYDFEFSEGKKALQHHIATLPKQSWVKLPAGEDAFGGFNVVEFMEPIFDTQRSETNRVAAMVANLVRSSALLNHKNRETKEIHIPNEGVKEVIVAEPQDVANILACREVLLASTHELDRKKQAICSAIDAKGGTQKMATIPQIIEYMRQGDAPIVSRSQVEKNLNQLEEHYLVEKYEGAAEDGKNMYKFMGWHNLGAIDATETFLDWFEDCEDPLTREPFNDSVKRLNEDIMPGAADFMDEPGVSTGDDNGQMQLGGPDIDLDPHEEAVRAALYDAVNGQTFEDMDEVEPSLYAMCGLTDLDHGTGDPTPTDETLAGTIFDPDHGVWNRPDVPNNWVETQKDAFNAVDEAITELHKQGVFETEVMETDDTGRPLSMSVDVMSDDSL